MLSRKFQLDSKHVEKLKQFSRGGTLKTLKKLCHVFVLVDTVLYRKE